MNASKHNTTAAQRTIKSPINPSAISQYLTSSQPQSQNPTNSHHNNPAQPKTHCLNPKIDFKTGPASLRTNPLACAREHYSHVRSIMCFCLCSPPFSLAPSLPFPRLRKCAHESGRGGVKFGLRSGSARSCMRTPISILPVPFPTFSILPTPSPIPLALHVSLRGLKVYYMRRTKEEARTYNSGVVACGHIPNY